MSKIKCNRIHAKPVKCVTCGRTAEVSFCLKDFNSEMQKTIKEVKRMMIHFKGMYGDLYDLHRNAMGHEDHISEPIINS